MVHFIENILNPSSIAFLGASNNLSTMGTGQLYNLKSRFKKSNIFPIHPKEENVLGLKAYNDISDLPAIADLLVIVLPTRLVASYLEKAGKFGIKNVVIVSAGFTEVGEKKGQDELISIAEKYNMRFIGPNCIGIINLHANQGNLNLTWFPFELPQDVEGNISLISQSGSWISQILIWAERRGLRLGKAISVGNEANISVTDCLDYFREDEKTKVIGIYLEGLKPQYNGRKFFEALQKTIKVKPVVINYIGGTEAGARAGMSHTASIGGKPIIYESIFKQAGVIRASSIEDLFEFCHAFSIILPPKGNRAGLITNSGGPASSLADACERNNIDVPIFSEELQEDIRPLIPKMASTKNPIDLTFDMNFSLFYDFVPRLIWDSNEVDFLIFYGAFGSSMLQRMLDFGSGENEEIFQTELMRTALNQALLDFSEWTKEEKVSVVFSVIDTGDDAVEILQKHNIAVFKFPNTTVRAMKAVIDYYLRKK